MSDQHITDQGARDLARDALSSAREAGLAITHHAEHDDTRFGTLGEKVDGLKTDVNALSGKVSDSVVRIHSRIDAFKSSILIGALTVAVSMVMGAAGIIWALLQDQIQHIGG